MPPKKTLRVDESMFAKVAVTMAELHAARERIPGVTVHPAPLQARMFETPAHMKDILREMETRLKPAEVAKERAKLLRNAPRAGQIQVAPEAAMGRVIRKSQRASLSERLLASEHNDTGRKVPDPQVPRLLPVPEDSQAARTGLQDASVLHEAFERQARVGPTRDFMDIFRHASPDVLLKEHNLMSRLQGPAAEDVQAHFRRVRDARGEASFLGDWIRGTYGERVPFEYGVSPRLTKAMRKDLMRRYYANPPSTYQLAGLVPLQTPHAEKVSALKVAGPLEKLLATEKALGKDGARSFYAWQQGRGAEAAPRPPVKPPVQPPRTTPSVMIDPGYAKALQAHGLKTGAEGLRGGKGDGKPDSAFDPVEYIKGLKVEREHSKELSIVKEIAKDHLTEDPKYYSKLERAGLADELEKKADTSQDDVFARVQQALPEALRESLHHVSGGLPDERRLSDVDIAYHTAHPQDLLSLLPPGTTVDHNDKRSLYNIPGYERPVGLYATPDPTLVERSRTHRDVELALAQAMPELAQRASALKQQGLGTEPAWAQVLGLKGDPYEAMLNKAEALAAAQRLGEKLGSIEKQSAGLRLARRLVEAMRRSPHAAVTPSPRGGSLRLGDHAFLSQAWDSARATEGTVDAAARRLVGTGSFQDAMTPPGARNNNPENRSLALQRAREDLRDLQTDEWSPGLLQMQKERIGEYLSRTSRVAPQATDADAVVMTGSHHPELDKVTLPPIDSVKPEQAAQSPGFNPDQRAYRAENTDPFASGPFEPPPGPRWLTAMSPVAGGYMQRGNGAARLHAYDISEVSPPHIGPWTPHIAVDPRGVADVASIPPYQARTEIGKSPYYERVIDSEHMPEPVESYRRLFAAPNTYRRVRGRGTPTLKSASASVPGLDISDYEQLYRAFDPGHDQRHMQAVQQGAEELAKQYAPNRLDLATLAAKLHDIGLSVDRERHEHHGAAMVAADPRFDVLGSTQKRILVNAIRQHRASTGKPSSVIGKIVSDADRVAGGSPEGALRRAVDYGQAHFPELDEDEQIRRALQVLEKRFSPGGPSRRTYFPETAQHLSEVYDPLIDLHHRGDLEGARALLAKQAADAALLAPPAPPAPPEMPAELAEADDAAFYDRLVSFLRGQAEQAARRRAGLAVYDLPGRDYPLN